MSVMRWFAAAGWFVAASHATCAALGFTTITLAWWMAAIMAFGTGLLMLTLPKDD